MALDQQEMEFILKQDQQTRSDLEKRLREAVNDIGTNISGRVDEKIDQKLGSMAEMPDKMNHMMIKLDRLLKNDELQNSRLTRLDDPDNGIVTNLSVDMIAQKAFKSRLNKLVKHWPKIAIAFFLILLIIYWVADKIPATRLIEIIGRVF